MEPSNTDVPKYYEEFRYQVESGLIPVCENIRKEMNRIEYLIQSPDYYFDNNAIEGWVDFCENELTLANGGDVKMLQSFKLWAEQALGWFTIRETEEYVPFVSRPGGRLVVKREFIPLTHEQYIIISRGNAKTMYLEFMHAYPICRMDVTTHQLVVAPSEALARETLAPFQTAIVNPKGPYLSFLAEGSRYASNSRARSVKIANTSKGIRNYITNSLMEFRPMSIPKVQGFRGNFATVDEWLSQPIREDVVNAISQGASKNDNYLVIAASSEGTVRNGAGDNVKMRLMNILNGKIFDPSVSIWYYRMDDIEQIKDKNLWILANPNLGITIKSSAIEHDLLVAESDPSKKNDILAKRFGIPMEGITYFFTYEETLPHEKTNFDGLPCSVGLDASRGDDFWAVDFLFPNDNTSMGLDTLCFITQSTYDQLLDSQKQKYSEFIAEGSLIIMNGSIIRPDDVFELTIRYIEEHGYYPISFGYDPYNAEKFVDMWSRSFGHSCVEKVVQGCRTESVPLGQLKSLAHDRALYFHHKIVQYCMGNACTWTDTNGNRKLFKQKREDKIDVVAAAMDALVAYTRHRDKF